MMCERKMDDELLQAYVDLTAACNAMMAELGYHGSIDTRSERVQAVMDALDHLDAIENGLK